LPTGRKIPYLKQRATADPFAASLPEQDALARSLSLPQWLSRLYLFHPFTALRGALCRIPLRLLLLRPALSL
jgi:hypothetical protein